MQVQCDVSNQVQSHQQFFANRTTLSRPHTRKINTSKYFGEKRHHMVTSSVPVAFRRPVSSCAPEFVWTTCSKDHSVGYSCWFSKYSETICQMSYLLLGIVSKNRITHARVTLSENKHVFGRKGQKLSPCVGVTACHVVSLIESKRHTFPCHHAVLLEEYLGAPEIPIYQRQSCFNTLTTS